MVIFNINYNIIILFCIFLMVVGCNNTVPKIIYADKDTLKLSKKKIKLIEKKKYSSKIVSMNKIILSENISSNEINDTNVVFEFRNERMLQGRENPKIRKAHTNKALTAVFKMFKQNLSSGNDNLNLSNNNSISDVVDYSLNMTKKQSFIASKNILVFLPFTGPYSNFGIKIRKSLDISILRFGSDKVKIIYFDTGKKIKEVVLKKLLDTVKPSLVIGPFTRSSLLKVKPFIKKNAIPMFTFSNDIALVEENIWSLGFSPEEQVDSVISCALINGYKRYGLIVPNNLYGNIILDRSIGLINNNKNNYFEKISLNNKQLNNKKELYSILKTFLNYKENNKNNYSKFDVIFIGGSKDFILEIAPLLAFYDVDSKEVQILGTEKFNNKEIKNEPSLEKSWFPLILSKKNNDFKLIWNESWSYDDDYFSKVGFDAGIIGINYLNQENTMSNYLDKAKGVVTGFEFKPNGFVKKPVTVMQIEKLGNLTKIKNCNDIN